MSFKQFFILFLVRQFHCERSIYAIYHLLKGKRTAQTIQDGFLYCVHPYFKTVAAITRKDIEKTATQMESEGWLAAGEPNHYRLTDEGERLWQLNQKTFTVPIGLDGWYSGHVSQLFWSRLNLLVQTASHLIGGPGTFIPVMNHPDTTRWVKQFLLKSPFNRMNLVRQLHYELDYIASEIPDIEASLLVHRLSGHDVSGLTNDQLADVFKKDSFETALLFQAGLHKMVKFITTHAGDYPLLHTLIHHEQMQAMTASARKTLPLLKRTLDVNKIAAQRGLKPTTIQDHIVEIAFHDPAFSIEPYVSGSTLIGISDAIKKAKTRKLSLIKQEMNENADYFQIRLVLAREGSR